MRVLTKNKQKMFYSNYINAQIEYERDDAGNIIYVEVDGEQVPVETGSITAHYEEPIEFKASISSQLNVMQSKAWGVDQSSIYSQVCVPKGLLSDMKINAVIWRENKIDYKEDGTVNENNADYKVVGVMTEGLTEDWYLLQRQSV